MLTLVIDDSLLRRFAFGSQFRYPLLKPIGGPARGVVFRRALQVYVRFGNRVRHLGGETWLQRLKSDFDCIIYAYSFYGQT